MLTKLKLIRQQKGLKAKDVALKAKVAPSWYCEIENDHADGRPSLEVAHNIARAIGVPADSLFEIHYKKSRGVVLCTYV